jgi:hypothetical protein
MDTLLVQVSTSALLLAALFGVVFYFGPRRFHR